MTKISPLPLLKSDIETVLNDAVSYHELRSEDIMDSDAAMYSIVMSREICAGLAGLDSLLDDAGQTFSSDTALNAVRGTLRRFCDDLEGSIFPLMKRRASDLLARIEAAAQQVAS